MLMYLQNILDARRRDDGASAVEYGLLIAAVAALIVVVVFALGGVIQGAFNNTCDTIAGSTQPADADCPTE